MKFALLMIGMLIVGCSGKGSNSVSSATASAWPAKWCQAKPGMTKEELVNVMGQPTSASAKQMTWTDDHYRFYAFLEDSGTVEQLDINAVDLTAAEKAGLAGRC